MCSADCKAEPVTLSSAVDPFAPISSLVTTPRAWKTDESQTLPALLLRMSRDCRNGTDTTSPANSASRLAVPLTDTTGMPRRKGRRPEVRTPFGRAARSRVAEHPGAVEFGRSMPARSLQRAARRPVRAATRSATRHAAGRPSARAGTLRLQPREFALRRLACRCRKVPGSGNQDDDNIADNSLYSLHPCSWSHVLRSAAPAFAPQVDPHVPDGGEQPGLAGARRFPQSKRGPGNSRQGLRARQL